jgi:HEAT repeat protein
MNSDKVEIRRRAILVLGKYRAPAARAALVTALADPDATVRRSALVSISEQSSASPTARAAVLHLLRDPDVHIRRIASSMLPELIATPVALAMARLRNRPPVTAPFPPRVPKSLAQVVALLNQALADKDAVVRKNILTAARYIPRGLDPERVAACFQDPDRDVRILAVQLYRRLPGRDNRRAAALAALIHDGDALVRRETARSLGRCGPAGTPHLQVLAGDASPEVRLEAVRQLAQQEVPAAFDLLVAAVRDKRLPVEDRAALVSYFPIYPTRAVSALKKMLAGGELPVQARALEVLALFPPAEIPTAALLPYLDAPSQNLRRAAVVAVSRRRRELDAETVRSLLDSRFVDVRALAVRLAGNLPPESRGELLFDACLDDDPEIRLNALRQIGAYQPSGWQAILKRSLEDPDPVIRRTAVDALLARRDPAGVRILSAFLSTCDDPALAKIIRLRLGGARPRFSAPAAPGRRAVPRIRRLPGHNKTPAPR